MGLKVLDIHHGSLFAIPLLDKTWGLGQALFPRFFEHKGKQFVAEIEVVVFRHIRVKNRKEIPLDTPLRREDIIFIYTDDGGAFYWEKCKLLNCVREPSIEYCDTLQYESRKEDPEATTGTISGPNYMLNEYFGLSDWWVGHEDPKHNAAVKINPNIRPPNAKIWVRPDPSEREPILCFYLFFKKAKARNEFLSEVKTIGYELIEKIPACKDSGTTAGIVICTNKKYDSQDQYEDELAPIAAKYDGYYDGMEQA